MVDYMNQNQNINNNFLQYGNYFIGNHMPVQYI